MSKTTQTLGIDLGVSSIGWALIEKQNGRPIAIKGMGVRIMPLSAEDEKEFSQGNAITKNQNRTTLRTQRKGLDRYQLRRKALMKILHEHNMVPDRRLMLELSPLEVWGLRAKAIKEKISLQELGRIWLHLNQRRGYNHSKRDVSDSKQTEYVKQVNSRYELIRSEGRTIGEHFYEELKKYFSEEHKTDAAYRIKEKVFPREAYIEEFDQIWKIQSAYYPSVLTSDLYNTVRNETIYYQRKLKSQKGLVNICEFEGKTLIRDKKEIFIGPKVAPRSSPLFQVEKIWESINNLVIKDSLGEVYPISDDQRWVLFNELDTSESLSESKIFQKLGLNKKDGYYTNAQIRLKGIQGNLTKASLQKILGEDHPLLQFELKIEEVVDKQTGEVKQTVSADFEKEPLYRLWHSIYSLDFAECVNCLISNFNLEKDTAAKLAELDFSKGGFGNKSSRAIRRILPYLQQGLTYDKACAVAGYNHSDSITKDENLKRELKDRLSLLKKNSLRQPIVEKILNQMINLVNAIIDTYGKPDEIRVELARELRQSREERNQTYLNNNQRERKSKEIEKLLLEHPEFKKKRVSKRDIEKYRLWSEFQECSPYEPGKRISLAELYSGDYEIEHIIPRSMRFDDSFGNKTLCHRRFNSGQFAKNNYTAFDYMQEKRSKEDLEAYLSCIEKAFTEKRISKTKYENLLCRAVNLKQDFIARQLNETRYIARKAKGILSEICHHVHTTTGAVTQQLRVLWGWDGILEQLNIDKYESAGLVETVEVSHNGQVHHVRKIKDWSKRDDHRHHAIDALTIACTGQGIIQRINTLNSEHTRNEMYKLAQESGYKHKLSLLDNYLLHLKPFDTAYVAGHVAQINISYKPGKKVATFGRRIEKKGSVKRIVQKGIICPRGPLSEESVYGRINRRIIRKVKLDKKFNTPELIVDPELRTRVIDHLQQNGNDPSKAFSGKKNALYADPEKKEIVTHVEIMDQVPELVIKYQLTSITAKDVPYIVDKAIREKVASRLKSFDNDHKRAWKDLENNPLWQNEEKKIPIKRVRVYTGLSMDSVVPIKTTDNTWNIEYEKFVKPGNNHHIAIYRDSAGKLQEHVVTFWHAVERKKYGLPIIIKDPHMVWDSILNDNRELDQAFLSRLPDDSWTYVTSMQQNECFLFGISLEDAKAAIDQKKFSALAPHIFRVRKLSSGSYWFNQQFETRPRESLADKAANRCVQASLSSMRGIKIKVDLLGQVLLAEENISVPLELK